MKQRNIEIWKRKLDWIAMKGGMALLNVHPDYINFGNKRTFEEYLVRFFEDFLQYVNTKYKGQYWQALPKEIAKFVCQI